MKKFFSILAIVSMFAMILSIQSLAYEPEEIMHAENSIAYQPMGPQKPDCDHSWTSWQIDSIWYGVGGTIDSCRTKYVRYVRMCQNCGLFDSYVGHYQQEHSWTYGNDNLKVCSRCGMQIGTASVEDIE